MGRKNEWKRPLRLDITQDGIKAQGNTVKDIEHLYNIAQVVPKPHIVEGPNIKLKGYGDDGETTAWKFVLGGGALLGLGALGRWLYKKYIKNSKQVPALPASPQLPSLTHPMRMWLMLHQCRQETRPLPRHGVRNSSRSTGRCPSFPRCSSSSLNVALLATRWR